MISIFRHVIDAIVVHSRSEAPNECCGLLLGAGERIDEAVPTRNLRQSPTRYQIDPVDHFAAIRRTRTQGREILGAYHSHLRTAAVPSAADIDEAHYPEFLYVIVSLETEPPDLRAYRVREGMVERVEFEIGETQNRT